MTTVSIHEAKAQLSALIAQVEDHQEQIVICRYGRAAAKLVPIGHGRRTDLDETLRKVVIHGDLTQTTSEEWEDA